MARAGRNEDALLGCDFILKMDARFAPARRLLASLRGIAAGTVVDLAEFDVFGFGPAARRGLRRRPPRLSPLPPAARPRRPPAGRGPGGAASGVRSVRSTGRASTTSASTTWAPTRSRRRPAAAPAPPPPSFPSSPASASTPRLRTPSARRPPSSRSRRAPSRPRRPSPARLSDAFAPPGRPVRLGARRRTPSPPRRRRADAFAPPAPAAFPAPAPAPAAGAAVDPRIAQFLRQGDDAAARGHLQEAIDLWSRVFLIDLSNEEASRRIDAAREKQSEAARQLDVLLSEGVQLYEAGDLAVARGTPSSTS